MVHVLKAQIQEMAEERRVLLDRLATLGLGGPLFAVANTAEAVAAAEPEADFDAAASELEQLTRLRRRPSQLAEALTRKAHRDHHKSASGHRVARVPASDAVNAALDQAEATGKNQA